MKEDKKSSVIKEALIEFTEIQEAAVANAKTGFLTYNKECIYKISSKSFINNSKLLLIGRS